MRTLTQAVAAPSRLAMVDIIAHVVLAFGIGLATAISLAGVVLLLVHGAENPEAGSNSGVHAVVQQVQGTAAWRSAP